MIAFVGSVFSPYYAWSGRQDPENHCAINVALYGPGARWTMTERGRRRIARAPGRFSVGRSAIAWDGDALVVTVDERAAPLPFPMRGTIRLRPSFLSPAIYTLDGAGRHRWWPVASHAAIEVRMEAPALSWRGTGYLDSNFGEGPLEDTFRYWTWSRAPLGDGGAAILYDVSRRDGAETALAIRIRPDGGHEPFAPPPAMELAPGFWRVRRSTRAEDRSCRIVRPLEDAPFYTRSELRGRVLGEDVSAVHESLDLDRFRSPVVKAMLPFRMPRHP